MIDWTGLAQCAARDPGGRGVPGLAMKAVDGARELGQAAKGLAEKASRVAIVTGFCVDGPLKRAETDGPPGALYLARALAAIGVEAVLVSDRYGIGLLEEGRRMWGLDEVELAEFPMESGGTTEATDAWIDAFLAARANEDLTHLVAIERVGPSHTPESLARQERRGAAPIERFSQQVPAEDRDVCHNMRGRSIDAWTGKTHRLFEKAAERKPRIESIGIGDGGNEIGMGKIAWEELADAIGGQQGARIACRVATDRLVIGGTSNWAAYALAGAMCRLAGRGEAIGDWGCERQAGLIAALVEAGAVDGVSGEATATVDGLKLNEYLNVLMEIEARCQGD